MMALFEKNGAVCDLNKRDQRELVQFVISECKKHERNIDQSTALYLVNSVGDDIANLQNEILKVCAYTKTEILERDIDAVCIKSVEATAFQMVDSLLVNNFDAAFRDIKVLFEQKNEAPMILGAIISTFVDMYRVKLCLETGHSLSELKSAYPGAYKSDFKLKNASNRARKYSLKSLERSLEILSKADFKLKTSFDDNRIVFEKLFIELAKARKSS